MLAAKNISCLFNKFILQWLIIFANNSNAYPQNITVVDSVNSQSVIPLKTDKKDLSNQTKSNNFYKTDSIFSFRSQKGYFTSLLHNFSEQATAPLRFKTKEWLITGAAVGITTTLILVDNGIDEWATTQKQKHNWVNKTSPVVTEFGGPCALYTVATVGLLSAAFKNQKGVQTSLLATQAMITSGFWVQLIKRISGRERPITAYKNSKLEGGKWYGPFEQYGHDFALSKTDLSFDAFPSGHTATAFSIATVFASQYIDRKAIPVLCYSAATLVGISRLTEHEHWASDVFVGALLGYLCGKQVVANYNKTHPDAITSMSANSKKKTDLTFIQYGNQIGLSFKW
jgi:hypothetical protein